MAEEKSKVVLWVVLAIWGGLVLLCGLGGALFAVAMFLFSTGPGGSTPVPANQVSARKTWPRDEFRKLLLGKTRDEVLETIGKPYQTENSGDVVNLYYRNVTVDPITGKVDDHAQVVIERGTVVRVSFG
jgi:outer membrane protein assembly factor BamE (lipoprotein component of BamABCDE complex)